MDGSLAPNTTLSQYRILKLIGSGGMGEVYLAEDTILRRKVAVKLLKAQTYDEVAEKRFLREARAVATLDHPNICTVYQVIEDEERSFIVMQYVEGETLSERMSRGPMHFVEVVDLGHQLASGLASAHEKGIVHRDIKPANVMIISGGQVKMLDFGLARFGVSTGSVAETESLLTAPGTLLGTVSYMAPEQVRGEVADASCDVFSVGVVLHEMLTGRRLFTGANLIAVVSAVLTQEPPPLVEPTVPEELRRIVAKALAKQRSQRYAGALELLHDLDALRRELEFASHVERRKSTKPEEPSQDENLSTIVDRPVLEGEESRAASRGGLDWRHTTAVTAAILGFVASGVLYLRYADLENARSQVPIVVERVQTEDYFGAYDLAMEIGRRLPEEPTVSSLMPVISMPITVTSKPPGASVHLLRFAPGDSGESPSRMLVGTTPIEDFPVARGDYVLSVEKGGYSPWERTVSGAVLWAGEAFLPLTRVSVDVVLDDLAGGPPEDMVRIRGGPYQLTSRMRPTEAIVELDDFWIDRYEVSNREYQEFIRAGGYRDPSYWRVPFVFDGKTLSFEEAMRQLRDQTGLAGPRGWSSQGFPKGQDDHPVTGITGYEAAAYAAFRGKELPTLYQWEKAARGGLEDLRLVPLPVLPWGPVWNGLTGRVNFASTGPVSVTSMPFGMSPYGCYHMAGNVAEWIRAGSGRFLYTGGSWSDLLYLFSGIGNVPPWFDSDRIGFRCVRNISEGHSDQGANLPALTATPIRVTPVDQSRFEVLRSFYAYDATQLDPRVEEVVETPDFRRETISFMGGGEKRALAYLYLPMNFPPPYQVIQYVPAATVSDGTWPLRESVETILAPYMKTGRAILAVVLEGFVERPWSPSRQAPAVESVRYRAERVQEIVDLRRGLDLLEHRDDVDCSSIAFFAISAGTRVGLIAAAIEPRYRAVVLVGSGLVESPSRLPPEINPGFFAQHIATPKLMLSGRYDEVLPYESSILPLYELFPEPKHMVTYDGGHSPSFDVAIPVITNWLDENLGSVSSMAPAADSAD